MTKEELTKKKDQVALYLFQPTGRAHGLAAMLQKHLARGGRALVAVDNPPTAEKVDDFLWRYSQDDFLPHAIAAGNDQDSQQPILIIPLAPPPSGDNPSSDTAQPKAAVLPNRNQATAIFFVLDNVADIAPIIKPALQQLGAKKEADESRENQLDQYIFLFCQGDKNHEAIIAKILALTAAAGAHTPSQWTQTTKGTWGAGS